MAFSYGERGEASSHGRNTLETLTLILPTGRRYDTHPSLWLYYRTPDRSLYMSHLLHLAVCHLHYAAARSGVLTSSTRRGVRDVSDILSDKHDKVSTCCRH